MDRLLQKQTRLKRRVRRVKHHIKSRSADRLRMVFNRSNQYLSVQIIDDTKGVTLCSASTNEKDFGDVKKNKEAAQKLGKLIAGRAKEKGVTKVVLDRRGRLYHGRIQVFADAARENGLEF